MLVTSTAGTGSPLNFGNQTVAGVYTVNAFADATNCPATMNGNATVVVTPLPAAFNVTGGGAYCADGAGRIIGLSGSAAGVTYSLLLGGASVATQAGTGNPLSFGAFTTAGTYTVQGTNNATMCMSTMNGNATITVNPLPTAFNVTGGGDFCEGGTGVPVNLSGSQNGVAYQLRRGGGAAWRSERRLLARGRHCLSAIKQWCGNTV